MPVARGQRIDATAPLDASRRCRRRNGGQRMPPRSGHATGAWHACAPGREAGRSGQILFRRNRRSNLARDAPMRAVRWRSWAWALTKGAQVSLIATGSDAEEAVAALAALVESGMGETEIAPPENRRAGSDCAGAGQACWQACGPRRVLAWALRSGLTQAQILGRRAGAGRRP